MASHQPLSARAYLRIASVGIFILLAVLVPYFYWIQRLTEYGLAPLVRFTLIFFLSVFGAVMLTGVMRSSAAINYNDRNVIVKVGGPAAVFFLIMWLGLKYIPDAPQTFDFTVRPQTADANQTVITSGTVILDLDSDRRNEAISPSGEADFKQIPWRFRGMTVSARAQIEGFENTPQHITLSGSASTLLVRKLPPPVTIFRGSIILPSGEHPNVKVLVDGQSSETSPDKFGNFEMKVDGAPGERIRVKVFIDGKLAYDDFQILPGPTTLKPHLGK